MNVKFTADELGERRADFARSSHSARPLFRCRYSRRSLRPMCPSQGARSYYKFSPRPGFSRHLDLARLVEFQRFVVHNNFVTQLFVRREAECFSKGASTSS